jgi:leucyl-tRNA synthetase
MSKSKNNGVDPQELIERYGADTARFFAIFASPPTNTLEWSDEGVEGSYRFLKRLWSYAVRFKAGGGPAVASELSKATRFEIHSVLNQANYDLSKYQLNTVASAAMKILNALDRLAGVDDEVAKEGLSILLRLLSPITPHICHHLWRELRFGEDVMSAAWPEPDKNALVQDEIEYVVQVNGKKRGTLVASKALDSRALEALVRASDIVKRYIGDLVIKKVIVVPGRLINIVV